MLFDSYHIWYIIISLAATIGLLIGFMFIKKSKYKNWVLMFFALATFVLHISSMYVNYLTDGAANADKSIMFPIYFCNLAMYLFLIVAFIKNKEGKVFKNLALFTAYAGIIGAIVSLIYPQYYLDSQNMFQWGTFKSLLSHSTLLVGCLYLFTGGFVKIRVFSSLAVTGAGLIGCGIIGAFLNWLFVTCGLSSPNSMYLTAPAIDGEPALMGWWIALMIMALVFIISVIIEYFTVPKGKRWYNKMGKIFNKNKPNK